MFYGLIIEGICLLALFILYLRARGQARHTVQRNDAIEQENQQLANTNDQLRIEQMALNEQRNASEKHLESLKTQVQAQGNILQSYTLTTQQLEKDAKERAEQSYQAAAASLAQKYGQQEAELETTYQQHSQQLLSRIKEEENKLKDLEDKQLAYIKAKQREEEIAAQRDYYRLVLEDIDCEEIKLLRNLQVQFSRKEAIDKLIWESYYKAAYDLLMTHLFQSSDKLCGIYKITNLENGQAYIGQSVDIKERFRQHIKSALTSGPTTNKLYQQMKKYQPENFTFEILESVSRDKLNEREQYWIDFYKTKDYGMNGTKGGS